MEEHPHTLLHKKLSPAFAAILTIDQHPSHPRDGDQVSTIATWQDRLAISERPDLPNPREFLWELYRQTLVILPHLTEPLNGTSGELPYRTIVQVVEQHYPGVILNLFPDNTSGFEFTTTPFTSSWQWDQIGYVYIDPAALDRYNVSRDRAEHAIQRELRIYEDYLNSRVYTITVTNQGHTWEKLDNIYANHDIPPEAPGLPGHKLLDSWLILMDIPQTSPKLITSTPWTSAPSPAPTRHNLEHQHTL